MNYIYECMNCDDTFENEKEAELHTLFHEKAFALNKEEVIKTYGNIPPTGMWKRLK